MADPERKGIPTYYKGIKMRSRLETLWARVFDALEIKWQYEPTLDFPEEYRAQWLPDFFLFEIGVLVECKPVLGPMSLLKEHGEVLRAARCAKSLRLPLLAVGQSYVNWEDAGAALLGYTFCPDLIGPGTGYICIRPGTKRWANVMLAGDWDGSHAPFDWPISFWRDNDLFDEPNFPDLWNHCYNANQWQPRRGG